MRAQYPVIPVIVVSASEDANTVRRARDFGAAGFIPKSSPMKTITEAIAAVNAGDEWFPPSLNESDDHSAQNCQSVCRRWRRSSSACC
ncbi:hypothetical protein RM530_13930 [Algiphilus sp. W345]|uniref:Response regulatory domain-containing protein n=1 Tax=Banduia mediterranea TaxID=3075609 RepID=A0ABU2WLL7_9GAMM|nr:hypothetical protein [Algiphilus sp. W345]MDT0498448.1 hypothetical protein [Algiphilus sp. W345]